MVQGLWEGLGGDRMGQLVYVGTFTEWKRVSKNSPIYFAPDSVDSTYEHGNFYFTGVSKGFLNAYGGDEYESGGYVLIVSGYFWSASGAGIREIGRFNTSYLPNSGKARLENFTFTATEETKKLMEKEAPWQIRFDVTGQPVTFGPKDKMILTFYTEERNGVSAFVVSPSVEIGKTIYGTLTLKQNTNRHKVTLSIGNKSHEISLSAGSNAFSYIIPMDWCNAITHSGRGQAVCKVETIDAQGKSLGTTQNNFTITVPSSVVPTIGTFALKPQNPNNALGNQYIQGKSKLLAQFTCGLAYGSPIASWTVEGAGVAKTGSGAPNTTDWNEIGTLTNAGNGQVVTLTLTDTRGRKAVRTLSINVAGYTVPKIHTAQVFRCNAEGVADEEGTSVWVRATWSYTALGGGNTIEARAKYKGRKDNIWIDQGVLIQDTGKVIGAGQFLSTGEYDVAIDLKDLFGTVTTLYPINVEKVVFDLQEDRAAFGMRASKGMIHEIPKNWNYSGGGYFAQNKNQHPWHEFFNIYDGDLGRCGLIVMDGQNAALSPQLGIWVFTRDANTGKMLTNAEAYRFPRADVGRSNVGFYNILTSKNPVVITEGGTGAKDVVTARINLMYINDKINTNNFNDYKTWADLKGIVNGFFGSLIANKPTGYGHVVSFGNGGEVFQLYCAAAHGAIYRRGANYSGWGGNGTNGKDAWVKLLDETDLPSIKANIQVGQIAVSTIAGSDATKSVTFSPGFSSTPYVFLALSEGGSGGFSTKVGVRSATGFTAVVTNHLNVNRNGYLLWLAVA